MTDKLELKSRSATIVSNINVRICYSELLRHSAADREGKLADSSQALLVQKQVGKHKEMVYISNNRTVVDVAVYQHNMLLKMAAILHLDHRAHAFYLTSPVIGTHAFALTPHRMLEHAGPHWADEETLYLDDQCQVTTTRVRLFQDKIYTVDQLFEGTVDMLAAATRVGGFYVLAVHKQIHVYGLKEAVLTRACIYCIEEGEEVKYLCKLNDTNLFLIQLWSQAALVCSIQHK